MCVRLGSPLKGLGNLRERRQRLQLVFTLEEMGNSLTLIHDNWVTKIMNLEGFLRGLIGWV